LPDAVAHEAEGTGLALLATIPQDGQVAALDAEGRPVAAMAEGAPARLAVGAALAKLFMNSEEKS
jgi:CO dehydrogenase nickel-insertion accessory protein CooC1